jgi:L-iditol 2-dehydrogenase
MVLTDLNAMEMADVEDVHVSADTDVLLRVGAVGICGSDVHYYESGRIGSQVVEYPYRVGHEFAGIVLEVGSAVTRLKPGDRVAVDPAMPCGRCDQCTLGREHTCRNLRFLGCPGQAEGCLSDYIVMPEGSCFSIGPETSLERAAIVEPLSIGVYSIALAGSMQGARIGILGCGPIGMCVMLSALAQGAETIYVTDKINERLALATKSGVAWTGNPDEGDVVGEIIEQEPRLLDIVFECCGQQEAIDQGIDLLKPGGKLLVVGIPRTDRLSFAMDSMRRKEICVQNVRRQNQCMQPALDLIESGRVPVEFMITHRYDFEASKEGFDLVANYQDGVMKAMIHVGDDNG